MTPPVNVVFLRREVAGEGEGSFPPSSIEGDKPSQRKPIHPLPPCEENPNKFPPVKPPVNHQ